MPVNVKVLAAEAVIVPDSPDIRNRLAMLLALSSSHVLFFTLAVAPDALATSTGHLAPVGVTSQVKLAGKPSGTKIWNSAVGAGANVLPLSDACNV